MTDQIISRETIRARARRAFAAGQTRDAHAMNPDAAALVDWLAEYDRLASESKHFAQRRAIHTAKENRA